MSKNNAELKKIFELAVHSQKNKDLDKAKDLYEKVLETYPNDLATLNNAGTIYKELRKFSTAIEYYKKALRVNKEDLATNYNLGLLFHQLDEYNNSINFYKKVIKINPKHLKTYINLMEIYDKTNNKKELEKIILYSKNFIKNKSEIIIYEGRFLFKNEKYKEVIKILESISFNEDQINLEHLRVLTLGKTYDHLKNPEKAFKYFVESNDIDFKIKNKKINKNIYLEIIKRREKYFKSYKLDRKIKPNLAKEKIGPFFMIGFPRSGTTLLDTILRSHPSVEVIEEKPIVEKLIYNLNKITKNNLQNLKKINKEQIQDLKKIYYKSLESNISKKNNNKIYIDKLPLNIIYVGEILKIFPNAKFIFSLRHPCDCVLSCFMQNFKINNAMANFLNIEDSAYLYDNVMKLWTIYLSNFTINFKQVRYEDLINNFNDTVKSVLKFLELPWSDSVLNYSETANKRSQIKTPSYDQVIKPIYTTASGRWKLYEKQISSIYPILEHWIKEFGY